ncbi:MAG: cyanophycinase-like exopeptidase [Maribacter sp.]|jgi:cyanophycinase-like exopeptidase
MMLKKITLLFLFIIQFTFSQNYVEYKTGNTETDVATNHKSGVCLMGGRDEQSDAMKWFLNQTDGGDVVVLRASGSDGYNDYFYSDLGVTINSVTTFVINNVAGATDAYVLQKVANAEAIWFAGGDQYDYVRFFKDNDMETALNNFINVKKGVIGGTSAGMAILGTSYFSAQNGTVTSAVAQANPYHPRVTLGYDDFLKVPFMNDVITDTHYDDRDQNGRHTVFLARFVKDKNKRAFGIAANEYTAICVGEDGKAYVYGEHPKYQEYAYFLQVNCTTNFAPENSTDGNPLNWNRGGEAVKVYKVPGTETGTNYFDLNDWQTGNGGDWQNWFVASGTFTKVSGTNPKCSTLSIEKNVGSVAKVYPNPFDESIQIEALEEIIKTELYDITGKLIPVSLDKNNAISTLTLSSGVYYLKLKSALKTQTLKVVKE